MGLKTPTTLDLGTNYLMIGEHPFEYFDNRYSPPLKMPMSFSTITEMPKLPLDGNNNPIMPVEASITEPILTQEILEKYLLIRDMIAMCIPNAETIVNRLKVISSIIFKDAFDGSNAYDMVSKYDFMKLKDNLIDFIKNDDKYMHLPTYGKKAGKGFRNELN